MQASLRKKRVALFLTGLLLLGSLGLIGVHLSMGDVAGTRATGARLETLKNSPQWDHSKARFANKLPRYDGSMIEIMTSFFLGGSKYREPKAPLPVTKPDPDLFQTFPASGLRVTWMGHSTYLVELDSTRTLVDPMWSERASPFPWAGPKRFYPPPIPIEKLPPLDAVLISHDHYDHLDRKTVASLASKVPRWIVPLGIGAHLEHWGITHNKIVELDWWQRQKLGPVTITATPSRHFSGRHIVGQNRTLWAGWAWEGPTRRLFYSGDTALHPEFEAIGDKLGPFDLTIIEIGAYNPLWPDVHLGPEQAVVANQLLRGKVILPAHWGLFDLAMHGWTEPVERLIQAAREKKIPLAVIPPGGSFDIDRPPGIERWWPQQPWESVTETPVWSSGVEHLHDN